ncbi:unnamed protein product, partial [Heterosigma akashiwo]
VRQGGGGSGRSQPLHHQPAGRLPEPDRIGREGRGVGGGSERPRPAFLLPRRRDGGQAAAAAAPGTHPAQAPPAGAEGLEGRADPLLRVGPNSVLVKYGEETLRPAQAADRSRGLLSE